MALTQVDQGLLSTNAQYTGFKNRIINGAMMIDQRNAGASVAGNSVYTLDRWQAFSSVNSKYNVQQTPSATETGYATRVNAGFTNYLAVTSSSAYSVGSGDYFGIEQPIEGYNVADLGFGTANAKTVTLSFWAYSSLTGTFGGALRNSAHNRSYPFSYSIPTANTWTQISITVAGDTSGTWVGATNGVGLDLVFCLGAGSTFSGTAGSWSSNNYLTATGATSVVGTNGATFYVTGVQLEVGSTATSFDYRPYGTELQLCQRYYLKNFFAPIAGYSPTSSRADGTVVFPVPMRIAPTALEQTGTASDYGVYYTGSGTTCTSVPTFASPTTAYGGYVRFNCSAVFSVGGGTLMAPYTTGAYLAWSAEL